MSVRGEHRRMRPMCLKQKDGPYRLAETRMQVCGEHRQNDQREPEKPENSGYLLFFLRSRGDS